jgi:hypothetical protein
MNSYMDDIYPSMTPFYNEPLSSVAEIYLYLSTVIGLIAAIALLCTKDQIRVYRYKRKNTDENPVIQI